MSNPCCDLECKHAARVNGVFDNPLACGSCLYWSAYDGKQWNEPTVPDDFFQQTWDAAVEDDCRQIVRLAVREDLDRFHDWTTVSLVPHDATARAEVVARQSGVIAGLRAAQTAIDEMNVPLEWTTHVEDGAKVVATQSITTIEGSARCLLTAERILLNLIGRLSGIATLTARYVEETAGTRARIYDTRKTTPGWRRLEKYAVRCGGGQNHRSGLYDGVLIKDNHLAQGAGGGGARFTPAEAVTRARQFMHKMESEGAPAGMLIEVEVDTLEQLALVLSAVPDIVLLDNMTCEQLVTAVAQRDATAPQVQLEASGEISIETVGGVAQTGVDRISVGALTHSAISLDVGLDWL
jgi:nicotinate-nucleotide pyrophosphorylase (carboxylating)